MFERGELLLVVLVSNAKDEEVREVDSSVFRKHPDPFWHKRVMSGASERIGNQRSESRVPTRCLEVIRSGGPRCLRPSHLVGLC